MEHLSREKLDHYREGTLAAQDLAASAVHLSSCKECRDALAGLADLGPAVGLLAEIGDARSEHLTLEQMDAWVDDTLDPTDRELVSAHIGLCDPCARELRSYEAAAPIMSETVQHSRISHHYHAEEHHAETAPRPHSAAPPAAKPVRHTEPTFGDRIRGFFQSPQLVIMTTLGIALAVAVPYMALQTLPDAGGNANLDTPPPVSLDLSSLDSVPRQIAGPIREILAYEEPTMPDILGEVPAHDGIAQVYPVSEAVETIQPTVSWDPLELGPYSVTLSDDEEKVVARVQGIPNTSWVIPVPLQRGRVYTWRVTAGNGTYEEASFLVLDEESADLMRSVRSQWGENHLVMGGIAQNLGLLTIAEREFGELLKQNPNAPEAAKLLDNVLAFRDQ